MAVVGIEWKLMRRSILSSERSSNGFLARASRFGAEGALGDISIFVLQSTPPMTRANL